MTMEIRDSRCQPWAWFDHTIIDEYAIKIGAFGVAVYMALVRYANNQDQTCYPSYDTLQARLGLSRKTVSTAITALIREGLIAKEQRRRGPKGRATNIYRILRTPDGRDRLVSDMNQPNVTESLTKSEVSSPDELTVSSPRKLTSEVSSPDELTVSFPGELEQDLVVEQDLASKKEDYPPPRDEPCGKAKTRKPPLSQQPGELHEHTIAAIKSMVIEEFHCLATPTKQNEKFWDAEIKLIQRSRVIDFEGCLNSVDSYYAANPQKCPINEKSARARMKYGIDYAIDKAKKAAPGRYRYGV